MAINTSSPSGEAWRGPVMRWSVLFLASLVMMMGYIFWNIISPVSTTLKAPIAEGGLGWTAAEYGFYTSSYTVFNLFLLMLFFGGVILDKCGIRFTGLMATGSMLLGSIINYYAVTQISPENYTDLAFTFFGFIPEHIKVQVLVSSLGFGLFGMGCDITGITVSKIITKWFTGYELASAMGTQVAMARLGTAMAFSFSPLLVQNFGVTSPLVVGAGVLALGFVLFIIYIPMDKRFDREKEREESAAAEKAADALEEDGKKSLVLKATPSGRIGETVFSFSFLLLALLCVLYYASIRTFMNFATDFMYNAFQIDKETAGWVVSSIPYGAIVLSPLFGILYDRWDRGALLMFTGCGILLAGLLLLIFPLSHSMWYVLVMMILIGVAFSLVPAAFWPTVPKMVPLSHLGTAYSIIYYVQNLGLFVVPIWIGNVVDAHTTASGVDYHVPILIFAALAAGAVAITMMLMPKRK